MNLWVGGDYITTTPTTCHPSAHGTICTGGTTSTEYNAQIIAESLDNGVTWTIDDACIGSGYYETLLNDGTVILGTYVGPYSSLAQMQNAWATVECTAGTNSVAVPYSYNGTTIGPTSWSGATDDNSGGSTVFYTLTGLQTGTARVDDGALQPGLGTVDQPIPGVGALCQTVVNAPVTNNFEGGTGGIIGSPMSEWLYPGWSCIGS